MKRILVLIISLSILFTFTCPVNAGWMNDGKPEDLIDEPNCIARCLVKEQTFDELDIDGDEGVSFPYWNCMTGDMYNERGTRVYATARRENVSVANGILDIKSQVSFDNDGKAIYGSKYSGSITTKWAEFCYNEIEIRAKVATGKGASSLAYLDFNESFPLKTIGMFSYSNDTNLLSQAVCTSKFNQWSEESPAKTWQTPIDVNEFHVYKLRWTNKDLEFYIDNKFVGKYDPADYSDQSDPTKDENCWPFNKYMYLTLRGSMSGYFAGPLTSDGWTLVKDNGDSKDYETHMYVDYIKQYCRARDYDLMRFKQTKPLVQKAYKKKKSKKLTVNFISAYTNDGSQVRVFKSKKDANKNKKQIASKTKNKHVMKIVVKNKKLKNKKKLYVRIRHSRTFYGKKFYTEWGKPKKVKIKK